MASSTFGPPGCAHPRAHVPHLEVVVAEEVGHVGPDVRRDQLGHRRRTARCGSPSPPMSQPIVALAVRVEPAAGRDDVRTASRIRRPTVADHHDGGSAVTEEPARDDVRHRGVVPLHREGAELHRRGAPRRRRGAPRGSRAAGRSRQPLPRTRGRRSELASRLVGARAETRAGPRTTVRRRLSPTSTSRDPHRSRSARPCSSAARTACSASSRPTRMKASLARAEAVEARVLLEREREVPVLHAGGRMDRLHCPSTGPVGGHEPRERARDLGLRIPVLGHDTVRGGDAAHATAPVARPSGVALHSRCCPCGWLMPQEYRRGGLLKPPEALASRSRCRGCDGGAKRARR